MTRQQILRYAKRVLLSLSVEHHNLLSHCEGSVFLLTVRNVNTAL